MLYAVLFLTVPAIVIWLALRKLPQIDWRWRLIGSGVVNGTSFSALLMWDDADRGFCCREYDATFWTELGMYIPLAIVFAIIGCSAVVVVNFILDLFSK